MLLQDLADAQRDEPLVSQYVMRSAIVHIGTVCAAILVREIMKEYFPDQVVGLKTWWVSVFGSRD